MFEVLATLDVPWQHVTIWQVDERVAPDGHPERNAGQLDLLPARSKLMPVTSKDLRAAAARYGHSLPEQFDVVHLGLGPDGHTASLFPQSLALEADPGRLVVINEDPLGHNPHPRMTLTFAGLARARLILVTVSGEEKRDAFAKVRDDEDVPAAHVHADRIVWIVDPAAAGDAA
jgi:6-phosphogluconolactonase